MKAVLDAEAVVALLEPTHLSRRQVLAALEAARRLGRPVTVTAVTLAELYRGGRHSQALDAGLARHEGHLEVRNTDRAFARLVGGLLVTADRGSEHIADAHVAAAAVETGGVVLTGDPDDLEHLVRNIPSVTVVPLRDSRDE